jgi:hypothetical protein
MYIQPILGRNVPDPVRGDLLPPEGRDVEPTQYWQRRLKDGDVAEATPESENASITPLRVGSAQKTKES